MGCRLKIPYKGIILLSFPDNERNASESVLYIIFKNNSVRLHIKLYFVIAIMSEIQIVSVSFAYLVLRLILYCYLLY
jgi:hypothetical protein